MPWLEDNEIQARLSSGDPAQIAEALSAIDYRLEVVDLTTPPALPLNLLKPLASQAGREQADRMSTLLLLTERQEAIATLAALIALSFPLEAMFVVALNVKVEDDAEAWVTELVQAIGDHLSGAGDHRVGPVGYFLDCLLDGAPAIRSAAKATMENWPQTGVPAKTRAEALR